MLKAKYYGRTSYSTSLKLMGEAIKRVAAGEAPELILLEHDPVITLGRSANPQNLLFSPQQLQTKGIELFQIGRGGDVTFHGPGQLVGYPIIKIGRRVKQHVMDIFEVLQDMMANLGVVTHFDHDNPGLWTQEGKLASVGIEIKDGISRHGFALNIKEDFNGFKYIVPCGLMGVKVCYLSDYLTEIPSIEDFAAEFSRRYASRKNLELDYLEQK